jgi:ADP-ribosyl-[dinitrogen reductase] hydrolase
MTPPPEPDGPPRDRAPDPPARDRGLDPSARDRALGALLGLAVGDALGTTVEFLPRGSFPPVSELTGGGPFAVPPGEGTDDTALAICLAESLLHDPLLDELDLMDRFRRWQAEAGPVAAGNGFDVGLTTREAIERFGATGNPIAGDPAPEAAGNGGVMRLAPVAVRHWRSPARARDIAARQSRTTHAAAEAVAGAELLAEVLAALIAGGGRAALAPGGWREAPPRIRALAAGAWRDRRPEELPSSGYVVHTLQAALCCAWHAPDFERAVVTAANLGDDADTVAAVTGQVAGALHGLSAIPPRWLARLEAAPRLLALGEALYAAACGDA